MAQRELKFRGRDAITGNWFYGYYYQSKGHDIIRDEFDNECIVLPGTVGQFTGMKDNTGADIYEGDIMRVKQRTVGSGVNTKYKYFNVPVEYWRFEFHLPFENYGKYRFRDGSIEHNEVIGNIYENSELLNE